MPIYEYTCSKCDKLSDVLQKLNDPAPERCPACGAEGSLTRVVSRTSFVLKGGGWGADLYASKKADSAPPPAAKEGAATPDKPAAPAAAAASPAATPAPSSAASPTSTPAAPKGESGS